MTTRATKTALVILFLVATAAVAKTQAKSGPYAVAAQPASAQAAGSATGCFAVPVVPDAKRHEAEEGCRETPGRMP